MKKEIKIIAGMVLIIALAGMVMAGEPFKLCWSKGQTVEWSLCDDDYSDLTCTGYMCSTCAHYRDSDGILCPANPNLCNLYGDLCTWFGGPKDETIPNIYVTEPQDGGVYTDDKIAIDLDSNENVYWYYKDHVNDPGKWTKICGKTDHCVKTIYLDEGENQISFRAEDETGNENYTDIFTFTVDSKSPEIKKFEPTRGFANGDFYVEFEEGNPTAMNLYIDQVGEFEASGIPNVVPLDLGLCTMGTRYQECNYDIDLTSYDGHEIEVWATLEDHVGSVAESRHYNLDVDMSPPEILTPNEDIIEKIEGKYVYFNFQMDEINLDEVGYFYYDGDKLKEKKLCSKLDDDGYCEKKINFQDGEHEITMYAMDDAGNDLEEEIVLNFFTDSKKPKIKKVEPRRGFTNGEFYVEIQEENPTSLVLKYQTNGFLGFIGDGEVQEYIIDLENDCEHIKGQSDKLGCNIDIEEELRNLNYAEKEIEVWAELEDRVGQTDESRHYDIDVDITDPFIENLGAWFTSDGKYGYFNIQIDEENFDEVLYLDYKGNYKRLCSKLDNGVCETKKYLRYLPEDQIEIMVVDEAGNWVEDFFDI